LLLQVLGEDPLNPIDINVVVTQRTAKRAVLDTDIIVEGYGVFMIAEFLFERGRKKRIIHSAFLSSLGTGCRMLAGLATPNLNFLFSAIAFPALAQLSHQFV
jgi:hypothetical protein